jgi:uncharacterized protein involved in cysteine biosynthesis
MAFLAGLSTLVLLTSASAVLVLGFSSVPAIAIIEPLIAAGLTAGLVTATLSAGGLVRRTLRWPKRAVVAEVISGALLLFIIGMVPIVGLVVLVAWTVAGLGAIMVTRFGSAHGWSLRPLAESLPGEGRES